MTNFTVDVITAPVADGDWSLLRSVLDTVPGSILLEDPVEPRLLVAVDAETPLKAATFVDGVSQVIGFRIESGSIYETPEVDFELDTDGPSSEPSLNTAALTIRTWFNEIPPAPNRGRHAALAS
ncbi:hypothetical protein BH11ACT4_BH11ACT4_09490 [soil metagenome]